MSFLTKSFLRCNSCGKTVETCYDVSELGLGGIAARDAGLDGWIQAGNNHHLCPSCAKPWLLKKEEMERELNRLAGVDTIEVDI